MKYKHLIASALLLAAATAATTPASAQTTDSITSTTNQPSSSNPHSTVKRYTRHPLVTTKIKLLTRAYGDSIVLRWAAEDFVSWNYLSRTGVNILRVPKDGDDFLHIDTLAYGLKALTQYEFQKKYPPSDSLALIPQGVLYGEAHNEKEEPVGTMGRTLEDNNEQDLSYGFAMLVAEWRKDLAEDMAVRFTDRTAKPGATYDYYIQPTVWENDGRLIFEPGVAEDVVNTPYEPEPFDPEIVDSLQGANSPLLGWWDGEHSSYRIERRMASTLDGAPAPDGMGEWQLITQKPYVPMVEQPEGEDYCVFGDEVPELGIYEYRIMGYDAFGDLSAPTEPHRVIVRDIMPPSAPQIKYIVLERPDDDDPMQKIIAHIVWTKDELEDDLTGYCINYSSTRSTGGQWVLLNDQMIAPADTIFSVDVTDKSTGMIYMAAYDNSGNEARSMVQLLEIRDYKAPEAPDSLRATIQMPEPDSLVARSQQYAYVLLEWEPCPDNDIDYYDIAFANDSTHTFTIRNEGGIHQPMFLDSLALDVNQKYIYYQVRAVDYSTNIGPWSPMLRVIRPHVTPPTQPHIDTSSHSDETGMHMEWIVGMDADLDYHVAYRRKASDDNWEVIGRYDQDSLANCGYRIVIDDNPPYDRQQRYFYYIESHNASPYTSQSLAISWLHKGPKVWPVDLKLFGDYSETSNESILAWEMGKLPLEGDYYICIYRKGPDDDRFNFMLSVPSTEKLFTDKLLEKGQSAQYYIMLQWRDGRQSNASNTVTVHRK